MTSNVFMSLGDTANDQPADAAKPLAGLRVLAAEQMAAMPFGTQLLARLGADVVKVEHPSAGDSGRGSTPSIDDPEGRRMGATFLRNNLNKRSVTIDLKSPRGVELFLELAPKYDIVCENFRAGTADRLGIGYDAVAAVHPAVIYASVSGFGNDPESPYTKRAAYASVVEAMSGIYEYKRRDGQAPMANPVGALGDISSALFCIVGILAALRHRDHTGEGQRIDVAMLDATMAITDIVTNFYSLGIPNEAASSIGIVETFASGEGHFVLQVVREHQFEELAKLTGHPEWIDDPRFAERSGWLQHLPDVVRPGIEGWAKSLTNREAVAQLSAAGLAAGESNTSHDIVHDPHVGVRNMVVAMDRPEGQDGPPVLIPGNPVKMSRTQEGPETRVPWLGEHTDEVLAADLGLHEAALTQLRNDGVIG